MEDVTLNDKSTQDVIDLCVSHYYKALENGVKPQEARRIIHKLDILKFGVGPSYSTYNYFKLRLDSHAQWEIRKTAEAMKELLS